MAHPNGLYNPAAFWRCVQKSENDSACWLWTGRTDRYGYGEYRRRSAGKAKWYRAHRVAYEALVGKIPEGLVVDHLCRVRNCVNPAHMELVTPIENVKRGVGLPGPRARIKRSHCVNGHALTPENTYVRRGKWRTCKTCAQNRRAKWMTKRKQSG